jgi:RNA polymerase sigma-70 factor (ECF subfamily)
MEAVSDETLFERYRQGDGTAFEEIYRRHSGKIYGFLLAKLRSREQAEDLFQVVFKKIHDHRHRYSPSLPLLPWIFTITRNTWLDHVRKKKTTSFEAEILSPGPDEPLAETSWADLEAQLQRLAPAHLEVLRLRYEQGLSFQEIAKLKKKSEVSLRKRVSRVLAQLRRQLNPSS